MLMAPVLAVVMALLIAGAVALFLPVSQPESSPVYLSAAGTAPPMPTSAASAADISFLPFTIMLVVAAVIVGLAVVLLFFRKEPP
jgi:hypothetical protein